ncbi:MAG: RNA polymerase sigma factor [Planctomycetes bacterium]|nr:RNA polymerase sigma factor [Planctomycetota bacterium]
MSEPRNPMNKVGLGEYGGDPMAALSTELMLRTKRGDKAAFDELVEQLRGRAFRVAQGWVGSRDDALELAQEAFLKTYKARDTFKDGEPFLPWFHRILRNTCFSHLRTKGVIRAKTATDVAPRDEDAPTDWEIVDDSASPSEPAESDERKQLFWTAYRRLGARDQEVLALRHFEELSYQAIADQLAIPIGTVMSRLFHARRRLALQLGHHLEVDFGIRDDEPRREGNGGKG